MNDLQSVLLIIFAFIPVSQVLISTRSHGGAKFGWFLAVLLLSWLAYIAFLIATQKEADQNKI